MASNTSSTAASADASNASTNATRKEEEQPRYTISVSCRGSNAMDGHNAAQVSFTVFKRTLIQQILDSSAAFFKIAPSQSVAAQLVLAGKQVLNFNATSTVEDMKLTTPDRQNLELVLVDEEPEVAFPVTDQFELQENLRARLYHPFVDAVRKLLDPDSPALQAPIPPPSPPPTTTPQQPTNTNSKDQQGTNTANGSEGTQQQSHGLDVDVYRASDVSLISLQNSPAACGMQGGEHLLLYRYGRCSREYWQRQGQPEKALKQTFAGLYISDFKNQFQGRAVFRHDLAVPLEYLLSTYCKWRGIDMSKASFLWLQFYMRVNPFDTGLSRGMDDGDTIYIFDRTDPQGMLWDGVLDGDVAQVRKALDAGARLDGPEGSFEAITSRWPLHAAAANSHLDVARELVERGGDVDKLDAVSEPALWHAVEQGHGAMVSLLLELGATASDLPVPAGKATKADYAALCHAAEKGSLAMVQLLLDKGANPYTYDDTGYCAYDYLVDQAKPIELLRALLNADKNFEATQQAYQNAYQRLCAAVKRSQRYPALGCNCRTCNSVVEVRAAEAEATHTLKSQIGCVALVRAVQAGGPHCLEACKLLHQHGALLDGQDADGRTALHQAIRYNRLAEARWLVSAGAHLDVPDFEGLLPLHQAACTGNVEFAKLLVEAGAPINLHTVKYITQESLEAQTKKQESANTSGTRKVAKKRNALDVTGLTTIGGNSALALAVRHGHAQVVEYLLSQQAIFDLKNPADSSAFHAALDRGAASVASKLLQHLNKPKPGKVVNVKEDKAAESKNNAIVKSSKKDKYRQRSGTLQSKDKDREGSGSHGHSGGQGGTRSGTSSSSNSDTGSVSSRCNHSDSGAVNGSTGVAIGGTLQSLTHAGDGLAYADSDNGADSDSEGKRPGEPCLSEPVLAIDAGAGLREMIQAERERLRQEKGLARPHQEDEPAQPTNSQRPTQSLMQQLEELKAREKAKVEAEAAAAERAKVVEAARKKRAEEDAVRQAAEEEITKKLDEAAKKLAEEDAAAAKKKQQQEDAEQKKRQVDEERKRKAEAREAAKAKAQQTTQQVSNPGPTGAGQKLQDVSKVQDQIKTAECADAPGGNAAAKKPQQTVQVLFRPATSPNQPCSKSSAAELPIPASCEAQENVDGSCSPQLQQYAAVNPVIVTGKKGKKGKGEVLLSSAPGTPSRMSAARQVSQPLSPRYNVMAAMSSDAGNQLQQQGKGPDSGDTGSCRAGQPTFAALSQQQAAGDARSPRACATSDGAFIQPPTVATLAVSGLGEPMHAGFRSSCDDAHAAALSAGPTSTASHDTLDSGVASDDTATISGSQAAASPRHASLSVSASGAGPLFGCGLQTQQQQQYSEVVGLLGTPLKSDLPKRDSFLGVGAAGSVTGSLSGWPGMAGAAAGTPGSPGPLQNMHHLSYNMGSAGLPSVGSAGSLTGGYSASGVTAGPPPGFPAAIHGSSNTSLLMPETSMFVCMRSVLGFGSHLAMQSHLAQSSGHGLSLGQTSSATGSILSPSRMAGGRMPGAGGFSPEADSSFWDDSHFESVVASVLPDEGAPPSPSPGFGNANTNSGNTSLTQQANMGTTSGGGGMGIFGDRLTGGGASRGNFSSMDALTSGGMLHQSQSPFGINLAAAADSATAAAVQQAWDAALSFSNTSINSTITNHNTSSAADTPKSTHAGPAAGKLDNPSVDLPGLDRSFSVDAPVSGSASGLTSTVFSLTPAAPSFEPGKNSHRSASSASVTYNSTGSIDGKISTCEINLPASLNLYDDDTPEASPASAKHKPATPVPIVTPVTPAEPKPGSRALAITPPPGRTTKESSTVSSTSANPASSTGVTSTTAASKSVAAGSSRGATLSVGSRGTLPPAPGPGPAALQIKPPPSSLSNNTAQSSNGGNAGTASAQASTAAVATAAATAAAKAQPAPAGGRGAGRNGHATVKGRGPGNNPLAQAAVAANTGAAAVVTSATTGKTAAAAASTANQGTSMATTGTKAAGAATASSAASASVSIASAASPATSTQATGGRKSPVPKGAGSAPAAAQQAPNSARGNPVGGRGGRGGNAASKAAAGGAATAAAAAAAAVTSGSTSGGGAADAPSAGRTNSARGPPPGMSGPASSFHSASGTAGLMAASHPMGTGHGGPVPGAAPPGMYGSHHHVPTATAMSGKDWPHYGPVNGTAWGSHMHGGPPPGFGPSPGMHGAHHGHGHPYHAGSTTPGSMGSSGGGSVSSMSGGGAGSVTAMSGAAGSHGGAGHVGMVPPGMHHGHHGTHGVPVPAGGVGPGYGWPMAPHRGMADVGPQRGRGVGHGSRYVRHH